MTLNVRVHPPDKRRDAASPPHTWEERLPRIGEMIRRYENGRGPHVIGMQEVRGGSRHPEQLADLRAQLPLPGYRDLRTTGRNIPWPRGHGSFLAPGSS